MFDRVIFFLPVPFLPGAVGSFSSFECNAMIAQKTYVRDKRHQEEKLPFGTFFFGILSGTFLIVHTNKKTNKITNRFIELISYNVFTKRHTNELYKKRKRIK